MCDHCVKRLLGLHERQQSSFILHRKGKKEGYCPLFNLCMFSTDWMGHRDQEPVVVMNVIEDPLSERTKRWTAVWRRMPGLDAPNKFLHVPANKCAWQENDFILSVALAWTVSSCLSNMHFIRSVFNIQETLKHHCLVYFVKMKNEFMFPDCKIAGFWMQIWQRTSQRGKAVRIQALQNGGNVKTLSTRMRITQKGGEAASISKASPGE